MLNPILMQKAAEALITKKAEHPVMQVAAEPQQPQQSGDAYAEILPMIRHIVQETMATAGGGAGGEGGKKAPKAGPNEILAAIQAVATRVDTLMMMVGKVADAAGVQFDSSAIISAVGELEHGEEEAAGGAPAAQPAAAPQDVTPKTAAEYTISQQAEALLLLLGV